MGPCNSALDGQSSIFSWPFFRYNYLIYALSAYRLCMFLSGSRNPAPFTLPVHSVRTKGAGVYTATNLLLTRRHTGAAQGCSIANNMTHRFVPCLWAEAGPGQKTVLLCLHSYTK